MRKCDGGKADGNMKVALIDSGIRKDLLANACVIEDLVVEESGNIRPGRYARKL